MAQKDVSKILLVVKNRRFSVFIDSLRTEGKEAKTSLSDPDNSVYKNRACRGLFRKKGL